MLHALDVLILLATAFVCYWPITRKPLSEDDGVWLYQAAFSKDGVRPFEDRYFPMGYFNVQWLYAAVARFFPLRSSRDYHAVKLGWYALTALSVYALGLALTSDRLTALLSAELFILATAMPNTLFMFTYAEHFFQLPLNLCLTLTLLGFAGGGWPLFLLAGLCAGWAVQMKIVTLAVVGPVFLAAWFAPSPVFAALAYAVGFAVLMVLPLALIRDRRGRRYYVHGLWGPVWQAAMHYAARFAGVAAHVRRVAQRKGALWKSARQNGSGERTFGPNGSGTDAFGKAASSQDESCQDEICQDEAGQNGAGQDDGGQNGAGPYSAAQQVAGKTITGYGPSDHVPAAQDGSGVDHSSVKTPESTARAKAAPSGGNEYVAHMLGGGDSTRLHRLRENVLPMVGQTYAVLLLAIAQLVMLLVAPQPQALLPAGLLAAFLLVQFVQNNYHTPHFNPVWTPVALLAAMTLRNALPEAGEAPWLAVVAGVLAGSNLLVAAWALMGEWRREGAYSLGHVEPRLGVLFHFAQKVGKAIGDSAQKGDELFVWGDQPSIYIHSGLPCWHPAYLFVYAHYGRARKAESIVRDLRRRPPRWILFYNWRVHDGWAPEKLMDSLPGGYREVHRFMVPDDNGQPYVDELGFTYDFPLLMRDDAFWQTYLLDRVSESVLGNGEDIQQITYERVRAVFPDHPEVRLRGELMGLSAQECHSRIAPMLAAAKGPERERLWLLLAEAADNMGEHEKALELYTACLKEFPLSARALSGAGWQTFALNDHARSFIYWTKAKAIFPALASPRDFKDLNLEG